MHQIACRIKLLAQAVWHPPPCVVHTRQVRLDHLDFVDLHDLPLRQWHLVGHAPVGILTFLDAGNVAEHSLAGWRQRRDDRIPAFLLNGQDSGLGQQLVVRVVWFVIHTRNHVSDAEMHLAAALRLQNAVDGRSRRRDGQLLLSGLEEVENGSAYDRYQRRHQDERPELGGLPLHLYLVGK